MSRPRSLVAWSSGKDSAWALHELRQSGDYEAAGLLTTYNSVSQRVPQHEVRLRIVELQAIAVGLPLGAIALPHPCPNSAYEHAMLNVFAAVRQHGISAIAYGDLHLADIRAYREHLHYRTGVQPLFPLWGRDTGQLAQEMTVAGLRGIVSTVRLDALAPEYAGREFNAAFVASLPPGVDRCGENGEFHTCVTAGPMLREQLHLVTGMQEQRSGYIYTDILPVETNGHHAALLDLASEPPDD